MTAAASPDPGTTTRFVMHLTLEHDRTAAPGDQPRYVRWTRARVHTNTQCCNTTAADAACMGGCACGWAGADRWARVATQPAFQGRAAGKRGAGCCQQRAASSATCASCRGRWQACATRRSSQAAGGATGPSSSAPPARHTPRPTKSPPLALPKSPPLALPKNPTVSSSTSRVSARLGPW